MLRFDGDGLVRVDAGVCARADCHQPVIYDSMIAKLIVWGETREQALGARAGTTHWRGTHIVGPHNQCGPSCDVVVKQAPLSPRADLDTALIERERTVLFQPDWASAGGSRPQAWSAPRTCLPSAFLEDPRSMESTGWLAACTAAAPSFDAFESGVWRYAPYGFALDIRASRRRPDSRPQ